ncbi:cytochrome d ubiquinol oxidase subunit II [Vulgatibacter incomptus]|uniref:Putative Cytochrome bd2, subunit II n=1 Tax=Vulgatibacter incomptus TaxID=1391653 RepID=A0A0K1PE81_9BACT|nr:cytochrome d ubiquinol oxidase subunit II [Vulgatibacter incomptus]AKU91439.1 putative Cytochrome bd2, subunit II [Vulgatibacter incomptus]
MILAWILAAILLVALILYAVLAGADFGAGFWDLFASGPRAARQRDLVALAIGPVWEANHVWLVLVVVLLFTAFPPAFSTLTIALHVPLALMLLGIVARASSYVFRNYDVAGDRVQRRWGNLFAYASVVTPVLLGVVVGAISSGAIRVAPEEGFRVLTGFFAPWVRVFPFAVGFFTLSLFAFVAASYLIRETRDPELQEDFRVRALVAQGGVLVFAVISAFTARVGAHEQFAIALLGSWWSWLFFAAACFVATASTALLLYRMYELARILAAAEAAIVVAGWGFAHQPFLIAPDVTIANAAAPVATLRLLVIVLAAGVVILFPSLYWLYRVFKREPIFEEMGRERAE